MRVRVWLDPNTPMIAGCMLRYDDGVMVWVEFRYEKVHKFCRRYGIIEHSTAQCPHLNLEIERMIEKQMEIINRRFDYETGYDLRFILFTNNLRAFLDRGRTTRTEIISRVNSYHHQMDAALDPVPQGARLI